MREEPHSTGVTLTVPDAYDEPSVAGTRGRNRAADVTSEMTGFEEVDEAFIEALLAEDDGDTLTISDPFELRGPARRRSDRALPAEEQTLGVRVEADPGESAVVLIELDGVYSWQYPDAPQARRRGGEPTRTELTFTIPLAADVPGTTTRSAPGTRSQLAGRVRGRILKFATDRLVGFLERNLEPGLVEMPSHDPSRWERIAPEQLDLDTGHPAHILLFIHGTFSSTRGSFQSLVALDQAEAFFEALHDKYDAVIGFDHPTMSIDPEQNALELLSLLRTACPAGIRFDAVSFSRGGLVLRSLVETLIPRSGWDATCERSVFVGATNGGTALAEPDNWRDFIDTYTNVVLAATRALSLIPQAASTAQVVKWSVKGLGVAVKFLASHAIDEAGVPGLSAMEPDGSFVREINTIQPGQPSRESIKYYGITSDFEPRADSSGLADELPPGLMVQAADRVIDRLLKNVQNDLVVDTPSMTAIDGGGAAQMDELLDFGSNPFVYHTVYFTQNAVGDALRNWLELRTSSRRGRARSAGASLLHQADGDFKVPPPVPAAVQEKPRVRRPALKVEVMWGDIRLAPGDVYSVGHYIGVEPQRAELALDEIVSGKSESSDTIDHLVLTELTRSNTLNGDLGVVSFFPWGGSNRRNRLIAVCGMGRPGNFDTAALRRLHRNLAQTLIALPHRRNLATVLIGSGEGALRTRDAVKQLLLGFGDALRATGGEKRLGTVRIVELFDDKAREIHGVLRALSEDDSLPLDISLSRETVPGEGGWTRDWTPPPADGAGADGGPNGAAAAALPQWGPEPQRITFVYDGATYRASAITSSAAIPEREIRVNSTLVDEAIERMTDPYPEELADLAELLFRLTLPRDFRGFMDGNDPLTFVVDSHTAPIHWEMVASGVGDATAQPIGLKRPVARQLRTTYRRDLLPPRTGDTKKRLNALVIGDPGDPERGENLPHAREEAVQVARFLEDLKVNGEQLVNVQVLIGAPNHMTRGYPPATRLEVLRRLLKGGIDLLHYAGHGSFDAERPDQSGWLFAEGLLTAGEIEQIDLPPALIVANACLTGLLSRSTATGALRTGARSAAALLPTLADEFFKQGVRNYIGTAWEIDDAGAVTFARSFYEAFLTGGHDLGHAVLKGRQDLDAWSVNGDSRLALWAAYQHYGDPRFKREDL